MGSKCRQEALPIDLCEEHDPVRYPKKRRVQGPSLGKDYLEARGKPSIWDSSNSVTIWVKDGLVCSKGDGCLGSMLMGVPSMNTGSEFCEPAVCGEMESMSDVKFVIKPPKPTGAMASDHFWRSLLCVEHPHQNKNKTTKTRGCSRVPSPFFLEHLKKRSENDRFLKRTMVEKRTGNQPLEL